MSGNEFAFAVVNPWAVRFADEMIDRFKPFDILRFDVDSLPRGIAEGYYPNIRDAPHFSHWISEIEGKGVCMAVIIGNGNFYARVSDIRERIREDYAEEMPKDRIIQRLPLVKVVHSPIHASVNRKESLINLKAWNSYVIENDFLRGYLEKRGVSFGAGEEN